MRVLEEEELGLDGRVFDEVLVVKLVLQLAEVSLTVHEDAIGEPALLTTSRLSAVGFMM